MYRVRTLVALADFDRRHLWIELGYSSLFWFLHRELGLSKGAAHYRKIAAELVQRFPEIVEPLRDGRLCITSVVELAKVVTPENRDAVVPRFFHRSKREAMEVTAELRPDPAPPKRDVTTVLRATAPAIAVDAAPSVAVKASTAEDAPQGWLANPAHANSPTGAGGMMPQPETRPATADPLTADLRRFHVTVSRRFLEKLEAARAALSHAKPGASTEDLLEAGLDLVLAQHAKKKALVARPRAEAPRSANSDHIPAHVKRAVWARDGGKCQWPVASGGICGCTERVEFAHRRSRARGGPPTVANLRLLCRFHNQLEARREFGDAVIDKYARHRVAPESCREAARTFSPR